MSFANLLGGADKSRFAQGVAQDYFTSILNVATLQQGTIAPIELASDIVAETTGAVGIGGMGRVGTAELADAQDNLVAELSGGDITFVGDVSVSGDVIHSGDLDVLGVLSALGGLEVSGADLQINPSASLVFDVSNAVRIGVLAGVGQGDEAVAIGHQSGQTLQGASAVAIGVQSGEQNQGQSAVAVGVGSGQTSQSQIAVAVGGSSGQTSQGEGAVAVGFQAGQLNQGQYSTALGEEAGEQNQGQFSVCIGALAGQTTADANSILINASGVALASTGASRTHINPIRGVAHGVGVGVMVYDPVAFELTYSTS